MLIYNYSTAPHLFQAKCIPAAKFHEHRIAINPKKGADRTVRPPRDAIFPYIAYSVRSAMTGSFLAAARAGKRPEIIVSTKDTAIMISACQIGSLMMFVTPTSE